MYKSLGLFNGRQHDSAITLPVVFALNSVGSDDYTAYGLILISRDVLEAALAFT